MKDVPNRVYISIRRHTTKFSRHGELASGICASWRAGVCVRPLIYSVRLLVPLLIFSQTCFMLISLKILIIKTNEIHYFWNLILVWYRTLHVSDRFTVHHQESSTVYTEIGICHTGCADWLLARSGCSMCTVLDSWWWTVNMCETCRVLFIHSVFCLTTGPKPPPKRCLHIVRSRASSFKWEYLLLSLRSSSSFLRLLPRLLATSISPFIFPSITCLEGSFYVRCDQSS